MKKQIEIKQDSKIPGAYEVTIDGKFIGLLTKDADLVPGKYELVETAQ